MRQPAQRHETQNRHSVRLVAALLLSFLVHGVLLYLVLHFYGPIMESLELAPKELPILLTTPHPLPASFPSPEKPAPPASSPEPPAVKKIVKKAEPPKIKPVKPMPVEKKEPAPQKVVQEPVDKPPDSEVRQAAETSAPAEQPKAAVPQQISDTRVLAPAENNVVDTVPQESPEPDVTAIEDDYRRELLAAIARYKRYPDSARRRGLEGEVLLQFNIGGNGTISQITVLESSGWRVLDRAAVKSVERLQRFKPIPENLNRENWQLAVTIRFDLE